MDASVDTTGLAVALARAWNEIMHARSGLPKPLYDRTTKVLADLDQVLLELHPAMRIEPIPTCGPGCSFCGSHGHG